MISTLGFIEKLRWRLNTLEHKYTQYRLSTNDTSIVNTEYGQVKGLKRKTLYDVPYYSFEGIPYAKPPVGELRFKAPEQPEKWEGVLSCFGVKNKATQLNLITGIAEGSDDCLILNVYSRNLKPDKPVPVMVWIHGGGFTVGEANREWFGPDYFMEKDVILVTIQYRLGVFGFLHLNSPDLNVPGNAGLKDQIMALKWVKHNISNFGGDPNCVTVFGESAGSASTHYLCITEQAKGLFHRAILMSGTVLSPWAYNDCEQFAFDLAKLAGYKGQNVEKDILEFLLKCKNTDLIACESQVLRIVKPKRKIMFAFAPAIEQYETEQCVISKNPRELMKTAWSNTIPIMVGCTSAEGLIMKSFLKANPQFIMDLKTCTNFVPDDVIDDEHLEENSEKLRKLHAGSGNLTSEEYFEICQYYQFYFPLHRFVLSRLTYATTAPTYLYRFDYDSEVLPYPYRIWRLGRGVKGVSHGDELSYLFSHVLAYRLPKDSPEYQTIQRTTGIWSKFAANGDPNDKDAPGMDSINWEPVKDFDRVYKCLNIGEELKIIDWPEMEKVKVWESTFDRKKHLLY